MVKHRGPGFIEAKSGLSLFRRGFRKILHKARRLPLRPSSLLRIGDRCLRPEHFRAREDGRRPTEKMKRLRGQSASEVADDALTRSPRTAVRPGRKDE
jgi:hypothetical protein